MPRKPSAVAHQKVLKAALQLVAHRGIDATSMDAVAQKSGVSKATIYNHWPDKDALLLEMMVQSYGLHSRPKFDTGHARTDMISVLAYRPPENADVRERILPHFMAYSARNRAFGVAWRRSVMEPAFRDLRRLIERGIEEGSLSPDLNMDLALGLLLGPMLYWHMLRKEGTSEDPRQLAEGVVDAFWKAFSARKR